MLDVCVKACYDVSMKVVAYDAQSQACARATLDTVAIKDGNLGAVTNFVPKFMTDAKLGTRIYNMIQ